MTDWQTGKPPQGEVVEAEDDGQLVRVRAIYGDKDRGVLPHWESEDCDTLYAPSAFSRWRVIPSSASGAPQP